MIGLRQILLVALIALGIYLFRRLRQRAGASRTQGNPPTPYQETRPCAHCGVYLPTASAVRDGAGRVFCCDEHRRAGGAGSDH